MPDHADSQPQRLLWSLYNTGRCAVQEKSRSTIEEYRLALQRRPRDPTAYLHLAACYKDLNRYSELLSVLKEGVAQCSPSLKLYSAYIDGLRHCNRREEAVRIAHQGLLALPGEGDRAVMSIMQRLTLPLLYDTPEEAARYRWQFQAGLDAFSRETTLDTPAGRSAALQALGSMATYDLACQGLNDRELLHQYGHLLQRVMAASFPQWAGPAGMPPVRPDGKLRVGYVSSCFLKNSLMKSHVGWLQEHDKSKIDIYTYHVAGKTDATTREVERNSTRFLHIPGDVEGACEAIAGDRLHVLVYLDIGLNPTTGLMGAARLAPVQCVTWGCPETCGLDTIDYYISSSLMEPDDAQEHYCERLVCLPGIGVCYRKPIIPRALLLKPRGDFGLRGDAVVYLSCHANHTHLPQYDHVFAEIARRVPNSQFVFLAPNEMVEADFRSRLERAFSAMGLNAVEYCVTLPRMSELDYWNLNLLSDIYLDTMAWSGCNTTMEAMACDLPVVTMPGKLMRARHSYAILTQLGVTETIARDEAAYVELAGRLGVDGEWRKSVIARMRERFPHLYGDTACVRALEAFYENAVREFRPAAEENQG